MSPYVTLAIVHKPIDVELPSTLLKGSAQPVVRQSVARVELPSNAREPKSGWYIVRGSLRVVLGQVRNLSAHAEMWVESDGHAAGYIGISRALIGGRVATWWTMYDLFTGATQGVVFGRSLMLSVHNVLPYAGVRPGRNSLGLVVHDYGGRVVRHATLLPGARILRGAVPAAKIALHASVMRACLHVGARLDVEYAITDAGYPAYGVGVIAGTSGRGLAVVGEPSRYAQWLAREVEHVRLLALAVGRYHMTFVVKAATGTGGMALVARSRAVRVVPPGASCSR